MKACVIFFVAAISLTVFSTESTASGEDEHQGHIQPSDKKEGYGRYGGSWTKGWGHGRHRHHGHHHGHGHESSHDDECESEETTTPLPPPITIPTVSHVEAYQ